MVAAQVTPVRALERLAVVHYRSGNTAEAKNVVSRLIPRAQDDAHALMMCAHLLVALGGTTEAVPLAYRALGLAQDRPDIHLAYAAVIHAIPENQLSQFTPVCAGIDTAVTLEIAAESTTYIVLAVGARRLWADEIPADSSIAASVAGKRQGEEVELPPTPLGPRNATIRAVQHKCVARYQQVLSDFNRRFPDATGLWKIKDTDTLGTLKSMLDMRAARIRTAMNAYEQRQITVGLLGRMVGRSGLETWRTLIGNREYRPFVRPGHQDALAVALDAIQRAPGVVLDPTAAITLFALDALTHIAGFHLNIHVPQVVIDAISEEIDQLRVSATGGPTLVTYKEGDTYYRHEISADQVRGMLQALERLRSQLRQFTVVGRPADSVVYENVEVAEALSAEFADAVAIAKADNRLLMSDDLLLKELASHEWNVGGVSSFDVLAYGVNIEQFTEDAFEAATISMVRWKFRGVPIRISTILLALKRSGYDIDDDLRELLGVLADSEIEVGSALRVALGVLRELWLSAVLIHRLHAVTDAILEALARNRGPRVLEQLKRGVDTSMRLTPQYAHTLNGFIDGFGKQRFSGSVIL
jgi:hypothetical protein